MAAARSVATVMAVAADETDWDGTGSGTVAGLKKDGAGGDDANTVAPDSFPVARMMRTRTMRMTRRTTRTTRRKRIHRQTCPVVGHGRCRSTPADR